MKNITHPCFTLTLSLGTVLLFSQCTAPATAPSAAVAATPRGNVTTQQLGDTTVMTRRLINHPLTNKDIGKVLEEITVVSPSGTSMQERVIVNVAPRLETTNTTKQ
jgi:hypothetical protein